ncbi:hypothetical protein [Halostagnicola sp. A-GB9-2]|uniref:hypothetical protein n=1 Tax=Halostagnicola sp. A-GB9-2 TaxID=3048066 RepID=UPI0024BF5A6F|nr:hypothetical protein [Halostagnicola sp. A-GB9-2]MDJ1431961.1 hypothetical protein [Halostagnicola sp. A-GB9-2]
MRIIALTCPSCGTIVAANELEEAVLMTCPGLECEETLGFEQLSEADRKHFIEHLDQYRL